MRWLTKIASKIPACLMRVRRKQWLFSFIFVSVLCPSLLYSEAVIDANNSDISRSFFGKIEIKIAAEVPIASSVRYLSKPNRIVIELAETKVGALPHALSQPIKNIKSISVEQLGANARIIMVISRPMKLANLNSSLTAVDGRSGLYIQFQQTSDAEFSELVDSLPYRSPNISFELESDRQAIFEKPLIVIDPGHGGNDPGAVRDGIKEKEVVLNAARTLGQILVQSGRYRVELTREADEYVSLLHRREFAQENDADLFLSIHADTVEVGDAQGTTIYLLSKEATSANAAKFAKFENRVDDLTGDLLRGNRADLALVLTDMALNSTLGEAKDIAQNLQVNWQLINLPPAMSRLEGANFAVLKAPDVPSLLLEIGFLSNELDRQKITDSDWLNLMSNSVLESLDQHFYSNTLR